jgi:hypothetical protein
MRRGLKALGYDKKLDFSGVCYLEDDTKQNALSA